MRARRSHRVGCLAFCHSQSGVHDVLAPAVSDGLPDVWSGRRQSARTAEWWCAVRRVSLPTMRISVAQSGSWTLTIYVTCRTPTGRQFRAGAKADLAEIPIEVWDRGTTEWSRALREAPVRFAAQFDVALDRVEVLGAF